MDSIPRSKHRRRHIYVDPRLQKWLTLGLVLLEGVLICATLILLHQRLHAAIDDTLYRVHVAAAEPLLADLLRAAWMLLAGFVVANIAALAAAETLWRRHVNAVLREFVALIAAAARLDFSAAAQDSSRHEVLALASTWRARERACLLALRERTRGLAEELDAGCDAVRVRALVHELQQLLPQTAASPPD